MPIPTARYIWLIAAGIPVAILSAWIPILVPVLIVSNIALLLTLFLSARLAPSLDRLRVLRHHDSVLSVRTQNSVALILENDDARAMDLRIRDEAPEFCVVQGNESHVSLGSGRIAERRYQLTPLRRGKSEFPGTWVRVLAPLGLAWVERCIENSAPVRVYPNVKALKDFDLLKQRGRLSAMGVRRSRIRGLGTEFESLRDYSDDDYRHIDWKSTARRGKLVVRQFEQERNQAVIVAIDVGRRMLSEVGGVTKLDFALDASLMLLHAAQDAGDQVGLLVFSDVVHRYVAPKKGRSQAAALLDAIHALEAQPVESDYARAIGYLSSKWKRRSLFVIFSDCDDDREAKGLVAALAPIARRHLVIIVRVSDPGLRSLLTSSPSHEAAFYQRAAATWFENGRRRARGILQVAGLRNLEAEPQSLAGALVSAYWEVKEESSL